MDAGNHFRAGHIQDLVAALIALEIVKTWVGRLQHGAHCSVGHYDTGGKCFAQGFDHDR